MTVLETLTARNAAFAADGFTAGLKMMPSLRVIVVGCVDPRVDPTEILGLRTGEAAVIRNVGGRVTPDVLTELAVLRKVTQAAGGDLGPGWEIVVVQHTDCGITRVDEHEPLLIDLLGPDADPADRALGDPHAAVVLDVDLLREAPGLAGVVVSGLVYDVETGLVERVTED